MVSETVAGLMPLGPSAVGIGQLRARDEGLYGVIVARDQAATLQLAMLRFANLAPRRMAGDTISARLRLRANYPAIA
jgi:hypothetical protein